MAKVLLVEDDQTLSRSVRQWLEMERHSVECVADGIEAMAYLKTLELDIIILDWQLPGQSGVELLKRYRSSGGTTPVLMLTGRDTSSDKEFGLDAGADDYLTKPFDVKELSARIRALLRRPPGYVGETISVGKISLDTKARRVTRDGIEVKLKPVEYATLEYFLKHPNEVINTEILIAKVWKDPSEVTSDAVYICINRLRQKLFSGPELPQLKTVHGIGYKLVNL